MLKKKHNIQYNMLTIHAILYLKRENLDLCMLNDVYQLTGLSSIPSICSNFVGGCVKSTIFSFCVACSLVGQSIRGTTKYFS